MTPVWERERDKTFIAFEKRFTKRRLRQRIKKMLLLLDKGKKKRVIKLFSGTVSVVWKSKWAAGFHISCEKLLNPRTHFFPLNNKSKCKSLISSHHNFLKQGIFFFVGDTVPSVMLSLLVLLKGFLLSMQIQTPELLAIRTWYRWQTQLNKHWSTGRLHIKLQLLIYKPDWVTAVLYSSWDDHRSSVCLPKFRSYRCTSDDYVLGIL